MKHRASAQGVTLVEMVVVLTVVAIIASIGATLVARIAGGQQGLGERLAMAQSADAAVVRLADEWQAALPNSLRVSSSADGVWIEHIPVADGGRYRAAADTASGSPGNTLDFSDITDSSFDVLSQPLATLPSGAQLVLQNLGSPDADAYAGTSRRGGLSLALGGTRVNYTAAGAWPQVTDTRRFFIVTTPVSTACVPVTGGFELVRYSGYGWSAAQPAATGAGALSGATRTVLLTGLTACAASYNQALANIGLLNLRLTLGPGATGAQMDFLQQVALDNTP
jgi:MSHA biogenesis protein MshO